MMTREEIEAAVHSNVSLAHGDFSDRMDIVDLYIPNGQFELATFARSKLSDAVLERCNLRGADFREANCKYAIFSGSDLSGAMFRNTDLRQADLDGIIVEGCIGLVLVGEDKRGYPFYGIWHDHGWMIRAGCRYYTIEEAREHWGEGSGSMNPEECLELAERVAALPAPVYPESARPR